MLSIYLHNEYIGLRMTGDKKNSTNKRGQLFALVAILLLGFLFRLSYTHTFGLKVDLRLFVQWARLMAREGLGAVYEQTLSAYPPLGTILLLPVGIMCPQCDIQAPPAISELFSLRLLNTGFDMLNAIILFHLGRKTRRAGAGILVAGLYFLFPTMALVSGWWGQNDSWVVFFMLLAGISMRQERPVPAWAFLALSTLIKLQAIILFPVFVAGTWRWFGWRRLLLSGSVFLLVLSLFCIPVLVDGQLDDLIAAITLPIHRDPFLQESHITLGGHNLWAGLALWKHIDPWASYRHTVISGITFQAAATSLLLLGLTLVAARVFISSSPKSIFAAMAISWLIFFQVAIGSGVRYLIPITVFLLTVAPEYPVWWGPCLGLGLATLFNLQDTIHRAYYPFLWVPLPGGVTGNIVLTIIFSLLALGIFFIQTGRLTFKGEHWQANRPERILTSIGVVTLVTILGIWLTQSANAQHQLEQKGIVLTDSMRRELGPNILAINWPEEISQAAPNTGFLSPSTGILPPRLKDMGAVSPTMVIYLPWAKAVNQVHHWETSYHGYHVTSDMLIERVFDAQRIVTVNAITDAPRMWRLAEITAMDDRTVPVARFGQQVQLLNAYLEYHDQIVFIHLDWNIAQPLADDVTAFVHVLGPDGQLVAQADGDTINNLIPLGQWHCYPDKVLQETRILALPQDAPPGIYTAAVGLYSRATLERLDVSCEIHICENQTYLLDPIKIELEDN